MDDYYSILAGAVSRLATNNAQARQGVYEYARTILIAHLDRRQISALETVSERVAFETAILRVEAESLSERSPETIADYASLRNANDISDFASLLREPALPADKILVGVSPPPSHLIPKKFTK